MNFGTNSGASRGPPPNRDHYLELAAKTYRKGVTCDIVKADQRIIPKVHLYAARENRGQADSDQTEIGVDLIRAEPGA